jgi:hypothetical protein
MKKAKKRATDVASWERELRRKVANAILNTMTVREPSEAELAKFLRDVSDHAASTASAERTARALLRQYWVTPREKATTVGGRK